jgi:thioredoxin-dependent peroxiredoxin
MDYKKIELEGSDNMLHKLEDFKTGIVLYFYPKDNTPGCTVESIDFTKYAKDFLDTGFQVIGVSRDSVKSHNKFIEDQSLDLLLLSDKDEELSKAFDVIKEKNMFGKKVMGIERSTFILDKNKDIIKEYRDVNYKDHAQEVLDYVKAL